MKYVSADIETLGLKKTCSIIEFGAVLDDLQNVKPLEELPRFHVYIKATEEGRKGEDYAMSMHPIILRRIANREEGYNYIYPNKLGKEFKDFLLSHGYEQDKKPDKDGNTKVTINIAGKNFMGFDDRFLEENTDFHKHIRVRSRVIDPGPLYYEPGDQTLPSLSVCLERAGFDPNVEHTSIADSIDVIKLVRKKYLN